MTLPVTVPRILLALVLGGLIGLERERRGVPAGMRTHMLVCAGSALMTVASIQMAGSPGERTRIAAQIVSGIGFLGAGTIFRAGLTVRGLTTAAGLWLIAGVGMGIAGGGSLLALSVITAVMVWILNTWLRVAEERWLRPHHDLVLTFSRREDVLARLFERLEQQGVLIHRVQWVSDGAAAGQAEIHATLHVPGTLQRSQLSAWISQQPGVTQVAWE